MRKFEYRSARFNTEIPLRYVDSTCKTSGVCTQLSCDGMEVHLLELPPSGNVGRVLLTFEDRAIDLEVRVAHVTQDRCGMTFVYKSDRERQAMNELVALASGAQTSAD